MEGKTILNEYAPNNKASKYIRQNLTELKRKMENYTITDEDANISLSIIDITSRQKISKLEKNNFTNPFVLIEIYVRLSPTTAEYKLFSRAYRTFTKLDQIMDHKTKSNK